MITWAGEAMRMNSVLPVVLFLRFGSFAGPPGKCDYLENLHLGYRHHNTGILGNRAGSVGI